VSVLDYLMELDWGIMGSVGSVLIPLIINTIRQAIKPENNDMSKV